MTYSRWISTRRYTNSTQGLIRLNSLLKRWRSFLNGTKPVSTPEPNHYFVTNFTHEPIFEIFSLVCEEGWFSNILCTTIEPQSFFSSKMEAPVFGIRYSVFVMYAQFYVLFENLFAESKLFFPLFLVTWKLNKFSLFA